MASKASEEKLAAGLLGLGIGVLLGAALSNDGMTPRRAAFTQSLRAHLAQHRLDLLGVEFARTDDKPLWILTLGLGERKIMTLHASVDPPRDPFAPETAAWVSDLLVRYLRSQELLAG